jgi:LmbE family N-acetylglucosaminyl deacetylase
MNILQQANERHLFIVPHCDDEVLGFGGLITRLKEKFPGTVSNRRVHVVAVYDTGTPRSWHQHMCATDAQEVLGYDNLLQLKLRPDINNRQLVSDMEQVIDAFATGGEFTLWSTGDTDIHQDHMSVFRAVCSAIRPSRNVPINAFLTCEVISSAEQAVSSVRNQFIPNFYVKLNEDHCKKKIQAMQCYPLELREGRDEEAIRLYAKKRGGEVNCEYAEAFMLHRADV